MDGVFIGFVGGFFTAGWLLPTLGRYIDRKRESGIQERKLEQSTEATRQTLRNPGGFKMAVVTTRTVEEAQIYWEYMRFGEVIEIGGTDYFVESISGSAPSFSVNLIERRIYQPKDCPENESEDW